MRKHKKLYVAIILLFIVVLIFVIKHIKICSINSHEADYVFGILQSEYNPENTDYIVEVPISDLESIAKGENGITKQEAEILCREVLGEKAEENDFPISYRCISAVSANNKLYYVMHITWLVDNNHWSYIGNCYVSSDGKEIYDGIVSSAKYEMTELKWEK